MSKGEVKAVIAGALFSGAISYYRLGEIVFTEQGIVRLVGNMLGGALVFWIAVRLYQRGERRP